MEKETQIQYGLYGSKLKILKRGTYLNDMPLTPQFIFIEDDKGNLVDIDQIMAVYQNNRR